MKDKFIADIQELMSEEQYQTLCKFADKIFSNLVPMDAVQAKVIDDNFWDLI